MLLAVNNFVHCCDTVHSEVCEFLCTTVGCVSKVHAVDIKLVRFVLSINVKNRFPTRVKQ